MHDFAAVAELAATQHGVVGLDQVVALGYPRDQAARWVRAGRLQRFGSRTFVVAGSAPTWEQGLTAGLLDLGPGALVGGRAAAALHCFDGYGRGPLEFLVVRHRARRRRELVVRSTRMLRPIDRTRVGSFACTSAVRTILDLAAIATFDEVADAVDSALRDGLVSEAFLRRQLAAARRSGRRGSRLLDEVLVDAGGHSRLERRFLTLVRAARLPRPSCQQIHERGGRFLARTDFCWSRERVVVEVAGQRTHASRRERQRDAERHTELQLQGYLVLTFTYEDVVERPTWVIARTREALAAR